MHKLEGHWLTEWSECISEDWF